MPLLLLRKHMTSLRVCDTAIQSDRHSQQLFHVLGIPPFGIRGRDQILLQPLFAT
jgi:hypothetical protein